MSEHKALNGQDLSFKNHLTTFRKIGGKVVEIELETPSFDDEDAMDTLLGGVTADEVEEGREKLMTENPALASQQMHDYLDDAADSLDLEDRGKEFNDPVRMASTKRLGMVMDRESGETFNFRRVNAGSQVELTMDDGEVIDVLANHEFDKFISNNEYIIV